MEHVWHAVQLDGRAHGLLSHPHSKDLPSCRLHCNIGMLIARQDWHVRLVLLQTALPDWLAQLPLLAKDCARKSALMARMPVELH